MFDAIRRFSASPSRRAVGGWECGSQMRCGRMSNQERSLDSRLEAPELERLRKLRDNSATIVIALL
ncbi:MAG: hypothetical protein R3B45_07585 [Bdellovibrionota bacterium]